MAFEAQTDADGVIWLAGEFDLATVDAFGAATRSALEGKRDVVVDLSGVVFLDSTAIRAIVGLAQAVGHRGVVLRRPRPNVEKILTLVEIDGRCGIRIDPGERPTS